MKRLSGEQWNDVFRNLAELDEETIEMYGGDWVEVIWLEGHTPSDGDEWVLAYGTELFEDGFKTEREAMDRLNEVMKKYYKGDSK